MNGKITLFNEEGTPVYFDLLDLVACEDKEYAVLLPQDAGDPPEVVVLQVKEAENEDNYIGVEDKTLLEKVF